MIKYTGRGLVVKRPGVLSKVQMLNLVLGVGVFSLLPRIGTLPNALPLLVRAGEKRLNSALGRPPYRACASPWSEDCY